MFQARRIATTAAILLSATGAHAQCAMPKAVDIPDGTRATREEMQASEAYVKQYMADMEAYLECLEREEPDTALDLAGDVRAIQNDERRAALDAMRSTAARFNEQVLAYKQAHP